MVTKKHSSNKKIVILVAVIVVAALAGTALAYKNSRHVDSVVRAPNSVDYGGPTKQEQAAGDAQKDANKAREKIDAQTPATTTTPASVILVDSTQYDSTVEIRAYVSNVYEDGGTCTATLTSGSAKVTKTSTAFKDATTTQCGAIDIARSEFSTAGTWNLTLVYSSPTSTGQATSEVKIN
ncbi:MAG: hypothetical protein JWM81_606 [Candidatus Saccharibacteria bacterium]|nr:hypothetical protein [Candidatus Saccharibacteria bacterium]